VVGAGVAGLTCAQVLAARGCEVVVYDQARAPGGRLATRLTEFGTFDQGATCFTVHSHRFEAQVQGWVAAGVAAPWPGRLIALDRGAVIERPLAGERYVGTGGMSAIGRHLARGLDLHLETRIGRLDRRDRLWWLADSFDRPLSVRGFEALVLALPAPDGAALLRDLTPLAAVAASVQWEPIWSAMLALSRASGLGYEAAFVNDDPILGWIARDDRKPERAPVAGVAERWVLQARPRWSRKYPELAPETAAHWLGRAFSARIGRPVTVRGLIAQFWRHALPMRPLAEPCLWDESLRVGLAGDWCGDARVEAALLSGLALAERI